MNKKKILKLLVASSTIAGGIGLSSSAVQAVEVKEDINKEGLTQDTTKVSSRTLAKVVNVSSNLNVRADAGTNYDTIGYICKNQEVEILSEKGDWYRISFEGREGYVSKNYLSIENDKKESTLEKVTKKGRVINVNSTLNIRQSTEANSAVLGTLKGGDTFEIISKVADWYNIKSNNIVGFIDAKYVQEVTGNQPTVNNVIQTITEDYEAENDESKAPTESGVVVNISSNLRVRNKPSTSSGVMGYLLNGQSVSIKGEVSGWYKIDFHGRNGYVSKEFIHKGNSQSAVTHSAVTSNSSGKVVNISSSLNIRSGAGTGHSIVGTLHNGASVNILGREGDWYHIEHNGVNGYVSAQYIQEVSESNAGGNPSQQQPAPSTSKVGKVVNISSSLNIRSGAGTGHSIVGTLHNGASVNILGREGDWYHIEHNGVNGYVSAQYIQEVSESNAGGNPSQQQPAPSTSKAGKVVNISSSLNIRSGAGTGHSVVGTLHNGASVNILGREGDWYHIEHNGVNGYVSAQYIQEVSESNAGGNPSQQQPAPSTSKAGKVVNISSSLNIRSGAGTGHSVVGTLHNGASVNILGREGDWYHIEHNGVNGYVSAQYIQEESSSSTSNSNNNVSSSGKGQVYNVSSNLRVRSAASTNSSVLGYLLNGQRVDIIGTSSGWVHINYNGTTGYVSADYIRNVDSSSTNVDSKATFNEVYRIMSAHVGTPYVWGGSGEYLTTSSLNSLKSIFRGHNYSRAEQYVNQGLRAFDCSGLMQWGFRQVGINIGRTTYDQIYNGYEVSLSNLQPGDLLFYGDLGHVGMYIGNGQWIEAPNSNANIRVVSVPWSRVTRARRVIG